jgi:CheY-like chemotaxis protein
VRVATGDLAGVPMIDPATTRQSSAAVVRNLQTPLAGLNILVAEDGVDNQRLIGFILQKSGAGSVEIASNGIEALQQVEQKLAHGRGYDVILMDMIMPEMDGYEAAGELRRKNISTPVIALTAHAMTGDREKCLAAGCDDYITKPIDRAALINAILRCVPGLRKAA